MANFTIQRHVPPVGMKLFIVFYSTVARIKCSPYSRRHTHWTRVLNCLCEVVSAGACCLQVRCMRVTIVIRTHWLLSVCDVYALGSSESVSGTRTGSVTWRRICWVRRQDLGSTVTGPDCRGMNIIWMALLNTLLYCLCVHTQWSVNP